MNKMKFVVFATMLLALMSVSAFAQGGAADNEQTVLAYKAIGGGIGFGLVAGLAAIGTAVSLGARFGVLAASAKSCW